MLFVFFVLIYLRHGVAAPKHTAGKGGSYQHLLIHKIANTRVIDPHKAHKKCEKTLEKTGHKPAPYRILFQSDGRMAVGLGSEGRIKRSLAQIVH